MKKHALALNVYRSDPADYTNGGITGRYDRILVECEDGPDVYDDENPPENLFRLQARKIWGTTLRLVPVNEPEWAGAGPMMGGNYATTCDSRLGRLIERVTNGALHFYGAIPVHDRFETAEQYRVLSM